MIPYLLDFHETIRFSKTPNKYQQLPYPLDRENFCCISWSTKKEAYNIHRIFMEQSGNILIFNIPGTLFRNIPRNFIMNVFQIYWGYLKAISHEYSTNIIIWLVAWMSISNLYLKRDFKISIFLWILWIIQEHLFCGGSTNSWFWNTSVGSLFNKVANLTSWTPLTVLER